MIPKIIHYCWFGGSPLPETEKRCIESWKNVLVDYEIICWDEKNFDVYVNSFTKQAYEQKKWAFVSDFARYSILYNYGGIYLDTDVEIIKRLDALLGDNLFMGFEDTFLVAPGLIIGAEKGHPLLEKLMSEYSDRVFVDNEGNQNLTAVGVYASNTFRSMGFCMDNTLQNRDGIVLYPMEYFCPKNPKTGRLSITSNTYSIHHYSASWYSVFDQNQMKASQRINSIFGMYFGNYINLLRNAIARYGFAGAVKRMITKTLKRLFIRKKPV